jgi:K+-transporting ATPase ATPase C chain
MKQFIKSIKAVILFSILLGLVYPMFITLIARFIAPFKANGSIIIKNNVVVGSVLISQSFTDPKYFQSRPSAVSYDAAGSGGSNYGPSNKIFMNMVADRVRMIRKDNMLTDTDINLPADMLLASASGLDPHISVENALIQVNRVSKFRKIPVPELKQLIDKNTDKDFIGLWGRPGVNVLKLNINMDEYKHE